MNRSGRTARVFFGAAALVLATSAVALAATYAPRSDTTARLADQALTYGSAESMLTAVALTHSRLSEALVATSGLTPGDVDRARRRPESQELPAKG